MNHRHFKANPATLYLGDNGRCLCGEHLGMTSKATGFDLDGTKLMAVTPAVVDESKALFGDAIFKCEHRSCTVQIGEGKRRR